MSPRNPPRQYRYTRYIYLSIYLSVLFFYSFITIIIIIFFFLYEIQPDQLVRYYIRYVITIGGQTYGRARSDIYVDRETLDWITFSVGGQRRYPDHRHEYVLVSRFWQRIGSVRSDTLGAFTLGKCWMRGTLATTAAAAAAAAVAGVERV